MSFLKKIFGGKESKENVQPTPAVLAPEPEPEPEPLTIQEISPQDLKARLDQGDNLIVVDMRQAWEYESGHIPGAIHIFINEIPSRLSELPKDTDIVFQCWHGNTSLDASGFLIENGWPAERVASLRGGIAGWVQTHGMAGLVQD